VTAGPALRAADLSLIHLVAARRRGEPAAPLDPAAVTALIDGLAEDPPASPRTAFDRSARLTAAMAGLAPGPLGRQVAMLALLCQLRLDGYQLTAPQGVLAAMVAAVAERPEETDALARWLEDRALAYAPPGPEVGW
jgi:hypothetical protein